MPTPTGRRAIDYDWDILIVLDGCRYDSFLEANADGGYLEGVTKRHYSAGSSSHEWLEANFGERSHTGIAVSTANPHYHQSLRSDTFAVVDHVWADERWDDDLGTVRAETVADSARQMAAQHPHKRLVVHFMQPHYPFVPRALGGGGRALRGRAAADGGQRKERCVWARALTGDVDWDDVEDGYRANLDYVLGVVSDLVADVDTEQKIVVTADHGNAINERYWGIPLVGHPANVPHHSLRLVPWHVVGGRYDVFLE